MNYARVCCVAAALAACAAPARAAASRRFTPGDSILDFVDTEQVHRLLAARRGAGAAFARNELGDGAGPRVVSLPADDVTEPAVDFRKLLKSSKNALMVTRKEYLKEDWCKSEPLVQKIREPGCLPVTVLNKFCYGQCNSFYIPKGPRRREGEERAAPAFRSCAACRPKKVVWVTVTLRCPGLDPPYRRKRLQKVKQCKCLAGGSGVN